MNGSSLIINNIYHSLLFIYKTSSELIEMQPPVDIFPQMMVDIIEVF